MILQDDLQEKIAWIEQLLEDGDEESLQKAQDIIAQIPGDLVRKNKNLTRHVRLVTANRTYQRREPDSE